MQEKTQRKPPADLMPQKGKSLAKQYMADRDNPKTLATPEKVQEFERCGKHVFECVWSHWLGSAEREGTIHGKLMWSMEDESQPQFHSNFDPKDPDGETVARIRVTKAFDDYYKEQQCQQK